MDEKKGIKELNEIIDALEVVAEIAGKVLADGKVNIADVKYALELLDKYKVFIEAVKGAGEVIPELKDIDQAELIAIGTRIYTLVNKIIEVVKEAKK